MKKILWVVTREENQYDQYGEYFVCAFTKKPTKEDIVKAGFEDTPLVKHILKGGGRIGTEDTWYHLRALKEGQQIKPE